MWLQRLTLSFTLSAALFHDRLRVSGDKNQQEYTKSLMALLDKHGLAGATSNVIVAQSAAVM
jgi:hypothetical protein